METEPDDPKLNCVFYCSSGGEPSSDPVWFQGFCSLNDPKSWGGGAGGELGLLVLDLGL